jgi:transposase
MTGMAALIGGWYGGWCLRLGCTRAELVQVLTGSVWEHHRFLLEQHLRTIEQLVAAFDARIEGALSPFHDIVERLKEVPGLGATAIETVIAEIGIDMSQLPSAGHLLSWAGFVPRPASAARRGSKKGAPWLKPVLLQSAWGAARKKNSYLQAQFLHLKARRGAKKAAIAVAASILTTVYHMLRDGPGESRCHCWRGNHKCSRSKAGHPDCPCGGWRPTAPASS